jgi:prevent-host-death family protein
MTASVGIAELRQNLSRYLDRVAQGERLLVTDRNRPVAELGPPPSTGAALRTPDAVHVAAAAAVSPIDAFVSYDERRAATARLAGLRTVAPGP